MGLSKEEYLFFHERYFDLKRSSSDVFKCEILDYEMYDVSQRKYNGWYLPVISQCEAGVLELLNSINHFARTISDLAIWEKVLAGIENADTRFSLQYEVIYPIADLALSYPAAIRGKLIFTTARALRDRFEIVKQNGSRHDDHELKLDSLEELSKKVPYANFRVLMVDFLRELKAVDDQKHKDDTLNFRNRAHHQIAPYIEFGQRLQFSRRSEKEFEGFSFGVERALPLKEIITPLQNQHRAICRAFKSFWVVTSEIFNSMLWNDDEAS